MIFFNPQIKIKHTEPYRLDFNSEDLYHNLHILTYSLINNYVNRM